MSAEGASRLAAVVAVIAVIACDDGLTPTEPTLASGGPLASKAEQGLASGGNGSIGVCNADALGAALASASPGDIVTIGACRVSGSFTVPEGVTLRGRNGWLSVIEAPAAGDGVVLETGLGTTVLERVRIRSEGGTAVRVHAGGAAAVRHAIVRVERGLGIAATGVARLSIERVALGGVVTRSTAPTLPPLPSPDATSTHGLFLQDVEHLSIDGVTIGGFGRVGALVAHSESKWDDVHVIGNAEVGLAVVGGTANLDDVRVHLTWAGGLPPGEPPAAVALVAGARVETHGLRISGNEGFGVFHDGTDVVEHSGLRVRFNGHAGIWAQDAGHVQLDDADVQLGRHAGVVAIDSDFVSMQRVDVVGIAESSLQGSPRAGDGIQLVRTPGDLFQVRLFVNERIGFLAELAPDANASDYRFQNVTVLGVGGALGAILQQGGAPLPLAQNGITRIGRTGRNDAAWVGGGGDLGIVGKKQPNWLLPLLILQLDGIEPPQGPRDRPE